MPDLIRQSTSDGCAVIELDRPPVNILNLEMIGELRAALGRVSASDARALLLRGAGKCFSAGADVAEHLPGTVERMLPAFDGMLLALHGLEIPTTAYVHGAALGGGFELALVCDFIVAAEDARLGLPEITLGVFPPAAAAILPLEIGSRRALDLILSGDTIAPRAALEAGLINAIGTPETAARFVERFARHPRPSLVAAKRASRLHFAERLQAAERIYLAELMSHPEPVEGLKAFLERRKPSSEKKP